MNSFDEKYRNIEKCKNLVEKNSEKYFNESCKQLSSIEQYYHCDYPKELLSLLSGFSNFIYKDKEEIVPFHQEYLYKKFLLKLCSSI